MACSAIYFLDMKGKVLISRNYRGDIDNSVIDKFIGRRHNSVRVLPFLMLILSTGTDRYAALWTATVQDWLIPNILYIK